MRIQGNTLRKMRSKVSEWIQSRRAAGLDDEAIRRETMDFGEIALMRSASDQIDQESLLVEFTRLVDEEIARTRP